MDHCRGKNKQANLNFESALQPISREVLPDGPVCEPFCHVVLRSRKLNNFNDRDSRRQLVDELRRRISEVGVSIRDLACQLSVTDVCARYWLRGSRLPKREMAVRIKTLLDTWTGGSGMEVMNTPN